MRREIATSTNQSAPPSPGHLRTTTGGRSAKKIDSISFIDVIKNQLRVMDMTSVSLCMENKVSIIVFNLFKKGSLVGVVSGEKIGTIIS